MHKSAFVVRGHLDRENHMLLHNFSTARPPSVCLLVSVDTMRSYSIWSFDVRQACLQRKYYLTRVAYVKQPAKFGLPRWAQLKFLKALYGLLDSDDYLHATLAALLTRKVVMTPRIGDPALYGPENSSGICVLEVTQVDDVLGAGNKSFQERSVQLDRCFQCKPRTQPTLTSTGVKITILRGPTACSYILHQPHYNRH